ncbi:MAG: hypothetical protein IJY47_04685 [Clostridia bacterium]|nr:hypothetical protein [Clostridia bacterium]
MKKKAIISSLLTIALCFSVIAGATYALFTSESKVNVAVTAGKVNVVATAENFQAWSGAWNAELGAYESVEQKDHKFANGGQLFYSTDDNKLKIDGFTPMDKVTFDLRIDNNSDVTVQYQTVLQLIDGMEMFSALEVKIDEQVFNGITAYSTWNTLTPDPEDQSEEEDKANDRIVKVSIELQDTDNVNDFQGETVELAYNVNAVQGNAYVEQPQENTVYLYTATDLQLFAQSVNNGNTYKGMTVKLVSDIDMTGVDWTPIMNFQGTFDGAKNNITQTLSLADTSVGVETYTISNLTVDAYGSECVGLFGSVSGGTVKNVTLTNAQITGSHFVGGIVGYAYGTIDNCHVIDSTITAIPNEKDGGYDNGDKVGGIVGFGYSTDAYFSLTNSSVTNITLKAYRDVGGIMGYGLADDLKNNSANERVTIIVDQTTNFYEVKAANVGGILGRYEKTNQVLDASNVVGVNKETGKSVVTVSTTIASVEGEDSVALENVLDSAVGDVSITVQDGAQISWETGASHGSTPLGGSETGDVTIIGAGADKSTFVATGDGVGPLRANPEKGGVLTLKDITVVDKSVSYAEDAWEFTYLEFGDEATDKLYFENVIFKSGIQILGDAEFVNCTFITEEDSVYAVWVSGGTATFEGCTFTGTRGFKAHEEYGSDVTEIVIENCIFRNLTKKPGVALGDLDATTVVKIADSTFLACQPGDQGLYIYESDTDVTTFNFTSENNKVYEVDGFRLDENGAYIIENVNGLFHFAETVNEDGNTYSGKTVKLGADIDLKNQEWIPIGLNADGANKFQGTFDGNGKTIYNLYVVRPAAYEAVGLFGALNGTAKNFTIRNATVKGLSTGSATDNGIAVVAGSIYTRGTIEGVKVYNATVEGNRYVGGISGYTYGNVKNCEVYNSTLIATPDMETGEWDNGDKVGGISGYYEGEGTYAVSGNKVNNIQLYAYRDVGGIVGCGTQSSVKNNWATNVTITVNQIDNFYEAKAENAAAIVGRTQEKDIAVPTSNTSSGIVIITFLSDGFAKDNAGNYYIYNANGLKSLNEFFKTNWVSSVAYGVSYNICADIDASSITWEHVWLNTNGDTEGGFTLNGNGHTISNLTINGSGMFGGTVHGVNSEVPCTVRDLTFEKATVTGGYHTGVIWGEACGDVVFNNVHVLNSNITGTCNVGALIGRNSADGSAAKVRFINCSVENCVITANGVGAQDNVGDPNGASAFMGSALTINNAKGTSVSITFGGNNVAKDNTLSSLSVQVGGEIYASWNASTNVTDTHGFESTTFVSVSDADALEDKLSGGSDVVLDGDVATNDELLVDGGVLDGNGATIDASNYTENGDDYECGINATGGVISNVTLDGAFRGLGTGGSGKYELESDLYVHNVTVTNSTYGINIGVGNGHKLYVTDSTICNWNSYSGLSGAEFINCTFTSEGDYYASQRISANATFTYTNCEFEQNTYDNENGNEPYYLDSYGDGTIVFENCYMDGVLITAENVNEFFGITENVNVVVNNG